jgi:hypothetical protein
MPVLKRQCRLFGLFNFRSRSSDALIEPSATRLPGSSDIVGRWNAASSTPLPSKVIVSCLPSPKMEDAEIVEATSSAPMTSGLNQDDRTAVHRCLCFCSRGLLSRSGRLHYLPRHAGIGNCGCSPRPASRLRVLAMTGDQSRVLKVGDRVCWNHSTTDLGTVIETIWNGVTIAWDDGQTDSIQHNDMTQIEPVPTKVM